MGQTEVELRFLVPAAAQAALAREMARGTATPAPSVLGAHRSTRRVRTRGAVVDVTCDPGRRRAADAPQRFHPVCFRLHVGSVMAMLALAERWRHRFGLVYDPRSPAAPGDGHRDGPHHPPVRNAARIAYASGATVAQAHAAVLDECLAQITHNAIGLCDGDPALRVAHVHQLRVGIRRLRSALRSFQGWVPPAPAGLVDELRALFATLGQSRDGDVMDSGVVAELAKVGAPPLTLPTTSAAPDLGAVLAGKNTQRTLLGWITWRAALSEPGEVRPDAKPNQRAPHALARSAERRLRRWHARVRTDAGNFDKLNEDAVHALRKRIKRMRYAVGFFAPLLRQAQVKRYLCSLAAVQDQMGALNDLFVARERYQALLATDAAAWFALGWLTARIAQARASAKPALARLAKAEPPTA